MRVGSHVRTATDLPGIPAGTEGVVTELGRVFVAVRFADGRTRYYAPRQLVPVREPVVGPSSDEPSLADLGIRGCRLPYGSHLCFLPTAREDPVFTLARYLGSGLAAGDLCTVIASPPWQRLLCRALQESGCDVERARTRRDLDLLDTWEYYYHASEFTGERQIERLQQLVGRGRRLRLMGHVPPILDSVDLDQWWEYERGATPVLADASALALCSYAGRNDRSAVRKGALATHRYVVSGGELTIL